MGSTPRCWICCDFAFESLATPIPPDKKLLTKSQTVRQSELVSSARQCQPCSVLLDGIRQCLSLHSLTLSEKSTISLFYYIHCEDDELQEFDVGATIETFGAEKFEVEFFRSSGTISLPNPSPSFQLISEARSGGGMASGVEHGKSSANHSGNRISGLYIKSEQVSARMRGGRRGLLRSPGGNSPPHSNSRYIPELQYPVMFG